MFRNSIAFGNFKPRDAIVAPQNCRPIGGLLSSSRPTAIRGFIVSAVGDAIDRQRLRIVIGASPLQEGVKIIPFLANLNSFCSIFRKIYTPRMIAAGDHPSPNAMDASSILRMLLRSLDAMPAGLTRAGNKIVLSRPCDKAAVANNGRSILSVSIGRPLSKHSPFAKSLPDQVGARRFLPNHDAGYQIFEDSSIRDFSR